MKTRSKSLFWLLTNSRALASWRRDKQRELAERWTHWTQHYLPAQLLELDDREREEEP